MAVPVLSSAQIQEPARVWALRSTKVYHCPKSRWYGKGKDGTILDECQAIKEGFKPAFGRGCGSLCKAPIGG
jgi:hypothetical protein